MEKKDNTEIQDLHFEDIHELLARVNSSPSSLFTSTTTKPKEKGSERKKRNANPDFIPSFSLDTKRHTRSVKLEGNHAIEDSCAETIEPPKNLPVKKNGSKKAKVMVSSEPKKDENVAPSIPKKDEGITPFQPKKTERKASSKPKTSVKASDPNSASNHSVSQSAMVPTSDNLSALWHAASASKAGKFAESQVWINKELYRQIEAFNLKCGKPVPTKHLVNAILKLFLEENKSEMKKAVKPI